LVALDGDGGEPERRRFAQGTLGKYRLAVPFGGVRRPAFGGKGARSLLEITLLGGKLEIHRPRLFVRKPRVTALDERGHALGPVLGGEGRVEQAAFES
jgi:hypothetical protein